MNPPLPPREIAVARRLEFLDGHRFAAVQLNRLEPRGLEVLEDEVLVVVLRLDRDDHLDALAAGHVVAVAKLYAVVHVALEQRPARDELVVLAADEDLVAGGRHRLDQCEERRLDREVDRPRAVAADDPELVGAAADVLRVDHEPARRTQRVLGGNFPGGNHGAVDDQVVLEAGLELAADLQVVIERQHGDRGVAGVGPLAAAAILDEPVRDRLDELVAGRDREHRPQRERRRLDAAVGPAPVQAVFAPVGGADDRGVRTAAAAQHDRGVRGVVALHTVLQVAHEDHRLVPVAELVRRQRQQRPAVRVELPATSPQVRHRRGFGFSEPPAIRRGRPCRQRVQHPRLDVRIVFLLDDLDVQEVSRPLHGVAAHVKTGLPCEAQPPQDVRGHEVVAPAALPPSPAAIGMLEVVQALKALVHDDVELAEVLALRGALGMGLVDERPLDTAEDPAQRVVRGEAEVAERPGGDHRGKKPAHRLLGAAVGVVHEVRQRVEHRDRHTRCDRDGPVDQIGSGCRYSRRDRLRWR